MLRGRSRPGSRYRGDHTTRDELRLRDTHCRVGTVVLSVCAHSDVLGGSPGHGIRRCRPGGYAVRPGTADPAPAPAGVPLILPEPTGDQPTGTFRIQLVDTTRADPLRPDTPDRTVVAQVWYPAVTSDPDPVTYAPQSEAAMLQQFYPVPPGVFDVPTHSGRGAAAPGSHPVVFFSHGLCGALTDSTVVAEQLASVGYVVVSVSVLGEDPAVELADGTVVGTADPAFCQAGADPYQGQGKELLERMSAARVDDVRFALDSFTDIAAGTNPDVAQRALPEGFGAGLDLARVGVFGHSFGGGTAAAVLAADDRFAAGVNLDGFVIGPVATGGVHKPFLVVGSSYHDTAFDPSWATFLPASGDQVQWLQVRTAGHYRFMDLGGSPRAWGLDHTLASDPETWTEVFGDIDDATALDIDRDLVTQFFDRTLRGGPAPILDDPARTFHDIADRTAEITAAPPASPAPTTG